MHLRYYSGYFFLFLPFLCSAQTGTPAAGVREFSLEISSNDFKGDSLYGVYQDQYSALCQKDDLAGWLYWMWDWQSLHFDHPERSLAILKTALHLAWRQPEDATEGEAFIWVKVNEGYHLFKTGRIIESVDAYEAAWIAWQLWSPSEFEVLDYLVLPLGAHYTRLGDNEKARTLYEVTLSNFSPEGAHPALAGVYNNLGLTWWNEGHYHEALDMFRRGLKIKRIAPAQRGLLHLSMAQAFFDDGRSDSCNHHLRQSFAWLEKAKDNPESENLEDYLAGAYLLKGRLFIQNKSYAEALKAYRIALRLETRAVGTTRHRNIGKIQVAIGELHLERKQPENALSAFHRALADMIPALPPDDVFAVPDTSEIYEENTLSAALRGKASACFELYQKKNQVEFLRTALACYHMAWLTDTRVRFALQYESSRLTLVAQQRKYEEKAFDIAHTIWRQTGEDKYLLEGWMIAERARAILLLDNLLRLYYRQSPTLPAHLKEMVLIRRQLAWLEQQLILEPNAPQRTEWLKLRQQLLNRLQSEEQKSPVWKSVIHHSLQWSAFSIVELAERISDYGIIEYFIGHDYIEIFSLQSGQRPAWIRIPHPDEHAARVQQLLEYMQTRTLAAEGLAAFKDLAFSVYDQLVVPAIRQASIDVRKLLVVPDRWLAFLPFEALITENDLKNWQHAPWLIRLYSINYAYSLSVFDVQSKMDFDSRANILQVAPMFEGGWRNLSPLRYSLRETPARNMCRSRILQSEMASWSDFETVAPEYAVLNLSTHAAASSFGGEPVIEFYDRAVLLPGIYSLPLQADLVVLSACESGLGYFQDGEGVMSMARAFTYAGAKGLVTSLWVINESATAAIIEGMYRWLRNGRQKDLALHLAKLRYLEDENIPAFQKSPYYWAALIYIGDAGPIRWHPCTISARWLLVVFFLVVMGVGLWWLMKKRRLGS